MRDLPDPARSAAVIIGVSRYTGLDPLPSVANNLTALRRVLTDPEVWGLPAERCRTVLDPETAPALMDPVVTACGQARDTLLVYYAGHGLISDEDDLLLTLPGSRAQADFTSVPYWHVRKAVMRSKADRRIVILDCCYSGRAIEGMSDAQSSLRVAASAHMDGSYVITSASETAQALSPRGEAHTAFTGELTAVLDRGVPAAAGSGWAPYLTLDTVYGTVRDALRAKNRPVPQQRDRGPIGGAPFVRNRALAQPPPPPRPVWWRRGGTVAAAAGVLLVAAAVPVAWRLADGDEPGRCSPRAALLGYSDQLDKAEYQGRRVYGLSSLAIPDPSTAFTLSAGSPPRLYELSLGAPGTEPDIRITRATLLSRADGTYYPPTEDFDGQALVLEAGGTTALVASRAGPAVGRYDLATGDLVDSFEVPPRFARPKAAPGTAPDATFTSLTVSPDGRHLYVGARAPRGADGTRRGHQLVRLLRYTGAPGGHYVPDRQYAYETGAGLGLADFAAVDDDRLLVLEHGRVEGRGDTVRVYQISLAGLPDVSPARTLHDAPPDTFAGKRLLVDLGRCPPSGAASRETQRNPLVTGVEGLALTDTLADGPYAGRRVLYLVSDDADSVLSTTRFYALAIRPY